PLAGLGASAFAFRRKAGHGPGTRRQAGGACGAGGLGNGRPGGNHKRDPGRRQGPDQPQTLYAAAGRFPKPSGHGRTTTEPAARTGRQPSAVTMTKNYATY